MAPTMKKEIRGQPQPEAAIQGKGINPYCGCSPFYIPSKVFEEIVLQISQSHSQNNSSWDRDALVALQTDAEHLMVQFLRKGFRCATSAGRVTVTKADIELARKIFEEFYPWLCEEADDGASAQLDAGEMWRRLSGLRKGF